MKKALTLFLKSVLDTPLCTVISYSITIITRICCMSIRNFCLTKCLIKCLTKTLGVIENTSIFKIGKSIDKEALTERGNFFLKNFCIFVSKIYEI